MHLLAHVQYGGVVSWCRFVPCIVGIVRAVDADETTSDRGAVQCTCEQQDVSRETSGTPACAQLAD